MENIEFTLTKTVNYDLKPYGKFLIKERTNQGNLPHILPSNEIRSDYNEEMPIPDDVDKEIVRFMKKNKTDVLVDGRGDFYTRLGLGLRKISHPKLHNYQISPTFRQLVDKR